MSKKTEDESSMPPAFSRLLGRLMYLLVRCLARTVVKGFFREVTIVGEENVPNFGPVIFVGNHNNQFVDASMLISVIPRRIRFLIAEISMTKAIVGKCAQLMGCIPVKRPQDHIYGGMGTLVWQKMSQTVQGIGSRFTLDVKPGDRIKITEVGTFTVEDVESDVELHLTEPIPVGSPLPPVVSPLPPVVSPLAPAETGDEIPDSADSSQLANSANSMYSVLPKVDQTDVYEAVSNALKSGSTICVFPEGGSHDRTDLLPLKPGVAVMALSSVFEGAQDVMIVPIGCNYFEAHKAMSRATVEIGRPVEVSADLVELYKKDRRAAVAQLLDSVEESLRRCIISARDYKTLKIIRLCATLYPPERMMLSMNTNHALCHAFSEIFEKHEDSKELLDLVQEVRDYALMLKQYGIPDHEVWQLKQSFEGAFLSVLEKIMTLIICILASFAMVIFWGPMRMSSTLYAERHRAHALKRSSVKIMGKDVVASYKITLVLFVLPVMAIICGLSVAFVFSVSVSGTIICVGASLAVVPYGSYWSHRCFTKILPLYRQIRSLGIVIFGSAGMWCEVERELITRRTEMQVKVRNVIDHLGPKKSDSLFMGSIRSVLPKALMDADTRRLQRSKDGYIPAMGRSYFECRQEII